MAAAFSFGDDGGVPVFIGFSLKTEDWLLYSGFQNRDWLPKNEIFPANAAMARVHGPVLKCGEVPRSFRIFPRNCLGFEALSLTDFGSGEKDKRFWE